LGGLTTFGPGLPGYLAEPARAGPGVLVVHDWYGLLPGVAAACDALATSGFVALAPDLYDGRATTDPADAEKLMDHLDGAEARERMSAAVTELRSNRRVAGARIGAIGWSMGGQLVLSQATGGAFDAVVAWYASLGPDAVVEIPVQLHLAGEVDFDPADLPEKFVAALRERGTVAEATTWPGTAHSFANPQAAEYDDAAAQASWARALEFLHRHLDDARA
jgi:carboxymethylenebutenolidase